jgi:hypothetical protein
MANAIFGDHPTDPDKVILRKPRYEEDDDIQEYKKPWVGLTDEDRYEFAAAQYGWEDLLIAAEKRLKELNA